MRWLRRITLRDDRGAVAIIVSLLMVVLLGFAAISIDVGRLYVERRQLQNGADAAVLAVACSRGTPQDKAALATDLAGKNEGSGRAQATVMPQSRNKVRVDTRSLNASGGSALPLSFAPVLGIDSATVQASATAGCGFPVGGTAALPLAFSYCAFLAQTGGGVPSATVAYTVVLPKKDETGCTGRSGNPVPGGFGWLRTDGKSGGGGCITTSQLGGQSLSDPGNSPSQGCTADLVANIQDKSVLLPLYEEKGGNGSHAYYRVSGYAAFHITGYYFAGQYRWNQPCSGSERCIRGYFTQLVSLDESFQWSPTGPDYGTSQSTLSE